MKRLPLSLIFKISFALFILMLFTITFQKAYANDKEQMFELSIKITHNELPMDDISWFIKDILIKHGKACKLEIKIRNIEEGSFVGITDPMITFTEGDIN